MDLGNLLATILNFYGFVIIVYVLMSWFPVSGVFEDVYNALAAICEPYLGIFRRVIPPIGMIDISPFVAILVLNLIRGVVASAL